MITFQLPLSLKLRDDAIFDNFFIGGNAQVVETLKSFALGYSEQFIYCYGAKGVGRTHLLQACCHACNENDHTAFYLPLANFKQLSPEIFDGLETQAIICLDDVDAITGDRVWEEALFHFYNRARDQQVSLLFSARCAPQLLRCTLPDLQSRLRFGLSLEIMPLTDVEKIKALQLRADIRGFHLSDDVSNYLIHHYSRNMRDLFEVFEKLDQASLAAKRKLTIPFVKSVIENHS